MCVRYFFWCALICCRLRPSLNRLAVRCKCRPTKCQCIHPNWSATGSAHCEQWYDSNSHKQTVCVCVCIKHIALLCTLSAPTDFDVSHGWLRAGALLWQLPTLTRSLPIPSERALVCKSVPSDALSLSFLMPPPLVIEAWRVDSTHCGNRLLLTVCNEARCYGVEVWSLERGVMEVSVSAPYHMGDQDGGPCTRSRI